MSKGNGLKFEKLNDNKELKKNKHIIILLVLFTALVIFEYTAPKPPDWKPSFKKNDKIPFGSYVLYELLEDIFPNKIVLKNEKSLYQSFHNKSYTNTSFLIITNEFAPDKVTLESLFEFVESGNKVFVAATSFSKNFRDTLNFTSEFYFSNFEKSDSLPYNFKNIYLHNDSAYWIKSAYYNFYFDSINSINTKAIATLDKDKINFFRQRLGKGELFIHNQPYAFTNYNLLLERNAEYVFKSLSFLDNETIIWDESFKPGKSNTSPMAYILSQEALRGGWYIILFLGLVFMFFSSKRMQRVIPVINKPENSSLEFAKTLGNLYLSGKNHKDIALKKYQYWVDFLREKYYIHLEAGESPNIEKTAEKTGVKEDLIKRILDAKNHIQNSPAISAEQLLSFNRIIEKFHAERK